MVSTKEELKEAYTKLYEWKSKIRDFEDFCRSVFPTGMDWKCDEYHRLDCRITRQFNDIMFSYEYEQRIPYEGSTNHSDDVSLAFDLVYSFYEKDDKKGLRCAVAEEMEETNRWWPDQAYSMLKEW